MREKLHQSQESQVSVIMMYSCGLSDYTGIIRVFTEAVSLFCGTSNDRVALKDIKETVRTSIFLLASVKNLHNSQVVRM